MDLPTAYFDGGGSRVLDKTETIILHQISSCQIGIEHIVQARGKVCDVYRSPTYDEKHIRLGLLCRKE